MRHFIPISLILFLLMQTALPIMAQDQTAVTADDVNTIAKQLYCPVCENEPLDTCQTQACIDWRDEIRLQLESGATPAQVTEHFRARYGDRVLSRPPVSGQNLVLWLGLPLLLILGGFSFVRYLRSIAPSATATETSRKQQASQSTSPLQRQAPPDLAPYIAEIEADLREK